MPFWGVTGVPRHSLYSSKLQLLKNSLHSSYKSFTEGSEFSLDRDVDMDAVSEVVEYRQGLGPGEGNRVAVPVEMVYLAPMFLSISSPSSLAQKDRDRIEVVLTLGKEALDGLMRSLKSSSTRNWTSRGEVEYTNMSMAGREAMHQSLLDCFSSVLGMTRNMEAVEESIGIGSVSGFVKKYFTVLEVMHDVLDNDRKLFAKYVSSGIVKASLDIIAEASAIQFRAELRSFLTLVLFNESLLEELFRVSLKVTAGAILQGKEKRYNPYQSFYAELHEYVGRAETGAVTAVGWLFASLLTTALKRAEVQSSDHAVHDKRKVNRAIKLCHAYLLQVSDASETSLYRNEILLQLRDSSSILTQYDPGRDFLAMYEALWADTKARLTRPVLSETDVAFDIRCTAELLRVHHRLLLDDEEKVQDCLSGLIRMCRLVYHGEAEPERGDLDAAQEDLLMLLVDLYHSLGKLEILCLHLCRAAAEAPNEKVDCTLRRRSVQSLLSRSFAELSEVQVVSVWTMLAAEAKVVSHLEGTKRSSAFSCLSWVTQASISVIISQPLSKRVNAKKVAVPTTALFALLEISIDAMEWKDQSSINRARALAALLLRVASSQVSQLSSVEMTSRLAEWRPHFDLVSTKLVQPGLDSSLYSSRNGGKRKRVGRGEGAVAETNEDDFLSHLLLFSAVSYVYVTQLQSDQSAATNDAAQTVLQVVERYVKNRGATEDKPLLLLQHADLVDDSVRSEVNSVVLDALLSEFNLLESLFCSDDDSNTYHWAYIRDNHVLGEVLSRAYASSLARVGQLLKGKKMVSAEKLAWCSRLMKFCYRYARLDRFSPLRAGQEQTLLEIVCAGAERLRGQLPSARSKRASAKKGNTEELASIVENTACLLVWSVQGSGTLPRDLLQGWTWKDKATSLFQCACHENMPSVGSLFHLLMSKRLEEMSRAVEDGSAEVLVEDVGDLCKALVLHPPETTHGYSMNIKSIGVLKHCLSRVKWAQLQEAGQKISELIDEQMEAQVQGPVTALLSATHSSPLSLQEAKAGKLYTQVALLRASVGVITSVPSTMEGLLRHIVAHGLHPVTAEALTAALGVVGDVLEAHREAGMEMASQASAEIVFRTILGLLQQLQTRPAALRVGLVRVFSEVHLQRRGDPGLSRAFLQRMNTYRCCSSDVIDCSRAMLTVRVLDRSFMDTLVVSAARALLLDASSKIYGSALTPRMASATTSSVAVDDPSDLLLSANEEEVAFFHCMVSRNANTRKRHSPGDDAPTGTPATEERAGDRTEWVTRVIYTYVVMASQLHILSAQSNESESSVATRIVEHCLTMLQEIAVHLSSTLEFCFPSLSLAIAKTLHYLLQAGEVMGARESRALALMRRILLTIASMRNLKRYFAGAAATIIEVLAAASGRRRGLDGLLSGVFALADGCGGFGRKSPIAPLLSPAGKALFAELTERYYTTIKYTG